MLLLLAAPEASCFVPRVMSGRIAAHTMPPPLYALLDPETKVPGKLDSLATGWKQQMIEVLDVNGDGRVDHKDAGAVVAMACLSWSLMAAPAMANGSSSHSSSHSFSSHSSSRSSSSRNSPSRTSSSSSSISSSSSRKSSSTYKSTVTSYSSRNNRSSSPSVSKVGASSSPASVSAPSSTSKTSSATRSLSTGNRVTMVSPKSSSARLNVKTKATTKVSPAKAINSQTQSNTVPSKTSAKSSQMITNLAPSSSMETAGPSTTSKKSSVSTTSNSKSSSTKAKSTTITSPKPITSSTTTKSANVLKTKRITPTKAAPSSNDDIQASSERKTKIRSGKRVGGRASKQRSIRESVEQETRVPVVIERNTYIVQPPISTPYYGSSRTIYSDYPPQTAYDTQRQAFSSSNSRTTIPRKQQQQEQLLYPPYKRPNPPKCNPKQQPKSKCNCDLPYDGEAIDVLVDPEQGLYVRGGVTFVDPKKCDFVVTIFSSVNGQPVQKSFHAINLEQFATKNISKGKSSNNAVSKK